MSYPTDHQNATFDLVSQLRSAHEKSVLNAPARLLRSLLRGSFLLRQGAAGGSLLAVLALLLGATPAAASPSLQLSNGTLATSQLLVGDDLWVGLQGGDPGATYDFRLSTSGGTLITGAYGTADAAGTVAPTFLWGRTGVVGCDCGAGADPEQLRFDTYQQAELALSGKSLYLQVLTLSGAQVARTLVPMLAVAREISYFSDAAGCPRSIFKSGESVHVSFLHPDRSQAGRQIFIAPSKPWPIGEPIRDVRGGAQTAILPVPGDRVTVPLGISITTPGSYDGIIRKETTVVPIRFGPDFVLGNPTNPSSVHCFEGSGGIIITQDGCPNCGGPSYP